MIEARDSIEILITICEMECCEHSASYTSKFSDYDTSGKSDLTYGVVFESFSISGSSLNLEIYSYANGADTFEFVMPISFLLNEDL